MLVTYIVSAFKHLLGATVGSIALDIPSNGIIAPFHGAAILKRGIEGTEKTYPSTIATREGGQGEVIIWARRKAEKSRLRARAKERDGDFGEEGRSDERDPEEERGRDTAVPP